MSKLIQEEQAKDLVNQFYQPLGYLKCGVNNTEMWEYSKKSAIILVEREYHSLRELLFNLRASSVIVNEKTYLSRIQELIDLEKQVKQEIEKL